MTAATRVGDTHDCRCVTPGPHLGGALVEPASPNVEANGRDLGRGADPLTCVGGPAPNFLVTGAASVEVNGRLAARKGERTLHPGPQGHGGIVRQGSDNVEIGGPSGGATLGAVGAGNAMCEGAKAGRNRPGNNRQSYENCGIEAARQLINQATGKGLTEDELLDDAVAHGEARPAENGVTKGPSRSDWRTTLAQRNGLPMHEEPQNMDTLAQAVAEGKGVITSHTVSKLWGPKYGDTGHAVVVTGMEFDAEGRPKTVFYNDTGMGECGATRTAEEFEASFQERSRMNVTDHPIYTPRPQP